jgi:hypothetical protein
MTKSQKELDNLLTAYYKEEKRIIRFNGSASSLGEYLSRLDRLRKCYAPLFADNTVDEEAMIYRTLDGDAYRWLSNSHVWISFDSFRAALKQRFGPRKEDLEQAYLNLVYREGDDAMQFGDRFIQLCKDLRYPQDNERTVSDFVRSIEDSYLRRQVGREKPATVSEAATALREYVEYGQTRSRSSMSAASVATTATGATTGASAATATGASTGASTGAAAATATGASAGATSATGTPTGTEAELAATIASLTNVVRHLQSIGDYHGSSSGSYARGQQWEGSYNPRQGGQSDPPSSYGRVGVARTLGGAGGRQSQPHQVAQHIAAGEYLSEGRASRALQFDMQRAEQALLSLKQCLDGVRAPSSIHASTWQCLQVRTVDKLQRLERAIVDSEEAMQMEHWALQRHENIRQHLRLAQAEVFVARPVPALTDPDLVEAFQYAVHSLVELETMLA